MGVFLYVCCMFSRHLFLRAPLDGYFFHDSKFADVNKKIRWDKTNSTDNKTFYLKDLRSRFSLIGYQQMPERIFVFPSFTFKYSRFFLTFRVILMLSPNVSTKILIFPDNFNPKVPDFH